MEKQVVKTPVGMLAVTLEEGRLVGVELAGRGKVVGGKGGAVVTKQLVEYFGGRRRKFELSPSVTEIIKRAKGTEFEKRVWREIAKIPYGETISYKELAGRVGKPKDYRAVANACGKNPVPIVVPCHRVVGSNGSLGGYSGGGVKNKRWLLAHEGIDFGN